MANCPGQLPATMKMGPGTDTILNGREAMVSDMDHQNQNVGCFVFTRIFEMKGMGPCGYEYLWPKEHRRSCI